MSDGKTLGHQENCSIIIPEIDANSALHFGQSFEEAGNLGEQAKFLRAWIKDHINSVDQPRTLKARFGKDGEDPRTPWTPIESAEKNNCEPVILLIDGPDDLAPIVGYWAHHEWVSLESNKTISPRYCAPIPAPPGGTLWQP